MITSLRSTKYVPPRPLQVSWDGFRGGLNLFLRQTELKGNELSQSDNLMLTGLGLPTKRWGSQDYFLAGATGYGRGLVDAKSTTDTREILSLTDWGFLTKQNGASYTMITGASWPSGYNMEGTQLNNTIYLVNSQKPFVKYDFTNLVAFDALTTPAGGAVTNVSGATGLTTWSWRVAATSQTGETLASTAISLASLPQNLSDTMVRVTWNMVSGPSGILTGYNIYRGSQGDETWVAGVDNTTTRYDDTGITASLLTLPSTANTTDGPKAKYIVRFEDRLVLAGITDEPTKVYISGRVPSHERFDAYGGGGYIYVDPDTGDDIKGLGIWRGKIIVYKESSVWQVTLGTVNIGNYTILAPSYQLITASQGCSNSRTVVAVNNDLYSVSRRGIFLLGQQPNVGGEQLWSNEISAKVRPFFDSLTQADLEGACAEFFDYKFIVAFPESKKAIIFDRERGAFMGPWFTSFGINKFRRITDSSGVERLLAIDSTDSYVSEFSKTLTDDKGTAFNTILKTKKENFGDWSLFKTVNELYTNFRNVYGTVAVNIYLEERDGSTITAKSFEITSQQATSGWGVDQLGLAQWGLTNVDASAASEEIIRKALLYKTSRTMQVEVTTSAKADNYELLGIKAFGVPQGRGSSPNLWVV